MTGTFRDECDVEGCTEDSDGPLLWRAAVIAHICEGHALALRCDPMPTDIGVLFTLNPAHAAGWTLTVELDAPRPVIREPAG